MKCKTQFRNQENRYEIYFAYEDYFGGTKFRSYDEMQEQGEVPNIENNNGTGHPAPNRYNCVDIGIFYCCTRKCVLY